MSKNRMRQRSASTSAWRSLEQLAETWGLSCARTSLVVKALVRSGRMEERQPDEAHPRICEYRLVNR